MPKILAGYMNFMWAGLVRLEQTGAIVPSQRFLIDKMIAPVPADYRGQVVELGAGNGALTLRLAARCSEARILACEINPTLARDTRRNLAKAGLSGRVDVVSDSAEHLLSALQERGDAGADFIISGIPLGNLNRQRATELIETISRGLRRGGMYIQFQHSLLHRGAIHSKFRALRTVPVFLNFPPAVIYYARR
jgi:phosphatidylethanolamine/phosphatidyl-N-methylethanolamine N-methyltransferase